jgi:type III secretion protein R
VTIAMLAATGSAEIAAEWSSTPVFVLVVMAALSLAPFVLLLMTSFVKIAVVLSILKSALGTAQIPPSSIITGLALVLTLFVMAPTGERMFRAVEPDLRVAPHAGSVLGGSSLAALVGAAAKAREPLREFLLRHAGQGERATFFALARQGRSSDDRASMSDRDFLVLVPAFVAAELRRAFQIGVLLFIPFLLIDLVISNFLVALGMNGLSPTSVALPFKLLLFVLADGWQLLLRGLVQSYG